MHGLMTRTPYTDIAAAATSQGLPTQQWYGRKAGKMATE